MLADGGIVQGSPYEDLHRTGDIALPRFPISNGPA